MKPLRIAVVGLKGIGRTHLKAIQSIPDVELAAVCDVLEDIAAATGAEYGVPHYTSLETLLAGSDIEAVSLGTPHFLHAPQAIQALQEGKHVITEKPMARTAAECDAMIDAARRADRKLGIHHQYRATAAHLHAKKLIDEGQLGPILRVANGALGSFQVSITESPGSRAREIAGDRALLTFGSQLELRRPERPAREFIRDSPEPWGKNPAAPETIEPAPLPVTGHAYMFQDFARAVREDREPFVPGEQGRWAVELVNAILMSHVLSRKVPVPVDRADYDRVLEQLAREPIPFTQLG